MKQPAICFWNSKKNQPVSTAPLESAREQEGENPWISGVL